MMRGFCSLFPLCFLDFYIDLLYNPLFPTQISYRVNLPYPILQGHAHSSGASKNLDFWDLGRLGTLYISRNIPLYILEGIFLRAFWAVSPWSLALFPPPFLFPFQFFSLLLLFFLLFFYFSSSPFSFLPFNLISFTPFTPLPLYLFTLYLLLYTSFPFCPLSSSLYFFSFLPFTLLSFTLILLLAREPYFYPYPFFFLPLYLIRTAFGPYFFYPFYPYPYSFLFLFIFFLFLLLFSFLFPLLLPLLFFTSSYFFILLLLLFFFTLLLTLSFYPGALTFFYSLLYPFSFYSLLLISFSQRTFLFFSNFFLSFFLSPFLNLLSLLSLSPILFQPDVSAGPSLYSSYIIFPSFLF